MFQSKAVILLISSLYFSRAQNNQNCAASEGLSGTTAEIFGGQDAKYAPWQVLLIRRKGTPSKDPWEICGGTIISKKFILTAAHCYNVTEEEVKKYPMYVIVGKLDKCKVIEKSKIEEKLNTVKSVHIHPDFKGEPLRNDIAILEVKPNFFLPSLINWNISGL